MNLPANVYPGTSEPLNLLKFPYCRCLLGFGVGGLERHLSSHPGRRSHLTPFALLVGMVLAFRVHSNINRVSVTKVLSSICLSGRARLGLYSDDFRPLSYDVIEKQFKRLERALEESWVDPDGTRCDLEWFLVELTRASIPPEVRAKVRAIAVDATSLETWAVTRYFGKRSLAADPMAHYQQAILNGDVSEPQLSNFIPPEQAPQ